MRLRDVYSLDDSVEFLYELLYERTPEQSISHKKMPTIDEHFAFFDSVPYELWMMIFNDDDVAVGSIYLTHNREVGIFIKKEHQGKGYGKNAIGLLREYSPGRLLANINPYNAKSRTMFEKMGAKMIQVTYELEP